uniref:hypothetical protein n=1 Tax=Aliarcobacter sp. TaxID=2321116 RepID=UPI00404814EC
MEVYEKINEILKKKKLSKKSFSLKIIELEPKLRNTGEVPTINALYSYLSGDVSLRIELIPYIAEVLDIPEQILFDESTNTRMKILKYITEDINSQEYNFLIDKLNVKNVSRIDKYDNETINSINKLFQYAPEPFLENILSTLKNFKALTDKFK